MFEKTYLFKIGDGEGRETYLAADLPAAIAQAKVLVRERPADRRENTVRISEAETSLAWAPSIDSLRHRRASSAGRALSAEARPGFAGAPRRSGPTKQGFGR